MLAASADPTIPPYIQAFSFYSSAFSFESLRTIGDGLTCSRQRPARCTGEGKLPPDRIDGVHKLAAGDRLRRTDGIGHGHGRLAGPQWWQHRGLGPAIPLSHTKAHRVIRQSEHALCGRPPPRNAHARLAVLGHSERPALLNGLLQQRTRLWGGQPAKRPFSLTRSEPLHRLPPARCAAQAYHGLEVAQVGRHGGAHGGDVVRTAAVRAKEASVAASAQGRLEVLKRRPTRRRTCQGHGQLQPSGACAGVG